MYNVRNLHTFLANDSYGSVDLVGVVSTGVIDTASAAHFGVYQGNPAGKIAGDMEIWTGGDEPSEESRILSTTAAIWHNAGTGEFYPAGSYIQVGLIYVGAEASGISVAPSSGYYGDGYVKLSLSYDSMTPPQIVWAVDTGNPPQPPTYFWTKLVGAIEYP